MSKLTLQLTPEMDAVLDELATSRDLPKSQVLRRAVLLMKYLDDQVADDRDILVRDNQTGEANRLVLESQLSRTVKPAKAAETVPQSARGSRRAAPAGN